MSMRTHRLSFFMVLCGVITASVSGCEEAPFPPDGPRVDPPVDPEDQLVVISKVRPPPITGGTLLVSKAGTRAVVADPDRDRIVVVDLAEHDVIETIALDEGDEPGRAVEDSSGRAHVALRRGGALVTVDLESGKQLARRSVCAAPRGLAHFQPSDAAGESSLIVACASGELVEIGAEPSSPIESVTVLAPDLRDVVITGDGTRAGRKLLVSSFRSARVITVGADLEVMSDRKPHDFRHDFSERTFAPTVAWRMIAVPEGAAMIHQRSATVPIVIEEEEPDGYGGTSFDCGTTIVNSAVTTFNRDGATRTSEQRGGLGAVLLPVDMAVVDGDVPWLNAGDRQLAFIGAANATISLTSVEQVENADACNENFFNGASIVLGPEPISVAFGPLDPETKAVDLLVQLREPSMLVVLDGNTLAWKSEISLGGERRKDSGHQLFHSNPEVQTTISCAACHPEGREDGHVWQFTSIGGRRTQALQGDITGTEPFHWDGSLEDMSELMTTVFEHRMGGFPQSDERVDALNSWVAKIPRVQRLEPSDTDAVDRGQLLFHGKADCASCHSGALLTNNESFAVGTADGEETQVPSLVGIRDRAPFMHDGCAATLHDRFDPKCGGTDHGNVDDLSDAEIDDLVAYMDSL